MLPTREELIALARVQPETVVDLLLAVIAAHEKRIRDLETRLQELESRLAKNSHNSSKPPSSDGYTKPAPKSLREKSDRPSGGQPGNPGQSLCFVDKPGHVVLHELLDCLCGCGGSLRDVKVHHHEKRQVFDLPQIQLEVTEHQAEVKRCPRSGEIVTAPFPLNVNAPVQYGSHFNALLVYWRDQQLLPFDRIAQMCADMLGRRISESTIQTAVEATALALVPFETHITAQLPQTDILHADETGLRVEGKLHWLHVLSNKVITWYGVHAKRGEEALSHFGHLAHFHGRLIHDCFKSYFDLVCLHALCNAHLLRELVFLFEQQGQRWARKMFLCLLAMHRCVKRHKARASPIPTETLRRWLNRYNALIAQGRLENPPLPPPPVKRRGRVAKTKAQNLLDRLDTHAESVLAFLYDPSVPFSNNQAEQDLRMIKVQQKISGGFRTFKGAQDFARIRSYLSTARKNNVNILSAISDAINGHPFLPTHTS